MKKEEGFTLVELLIVVGLIAVLAAVGVPMYERAQMKARRAECKSMLSTCYALQQKYFLEWNQYSRIFQQASDGTKKIAMDPTGKNFPSKGAFADGKFMYYDYGVAAENSPFDPLSAHLTERLDYYNYIDYSGNSVDDVGDANNFMSGADNDDYFETDFVPGVRAFFCGCIGNIDGDPAFDGLVVSESYTEPEFMLDVQAGGVGINWIGDDISLTTR